MGTIVLVQMTDASFGGVRPFDGHLSSFAYRYTTDEPRTGINTNEPVDIRELPTSGYQRPGFLDVLDRALERGWSHAVVPVYTKKNSEPGPRIMTDVQTSVTEKVRTGDETFVRTAQRGLAEEIGCCAKYMEKITATSFVASGLRPFDPVIDKFRDGSDIKRTVQVLPVGTYDELFTLLSSIAARSGTSSPKELQNISMVCIMPLDVLAERARFVAH